MNLQELADLAHPLAAGDAALSRFLEGLLSHLAGLHARIAELESADTDPSLQSAGAQPAKGEESNAG
jgi:hypothetical protein